MTTRFKHDAILIGFIELDTLTTRSFKDMYELTDTGHRLSAVWTAFVVKGLVAKKQIKNPGRGPNVVLEFSLTKLGKSYLAEHGSELDIASLKTHLELPITSPHTKKPPTPNLNASANAAIEGISALIEDYEQMKNLLKRFRADIDSIIKE